MEFSTEQQFKSFMSQYSIIEDLDIVVGTTPSGVSIADYLVRDLLVIELKTLKIDPTPKMNEYYQEIMMRSDFPAIYGELDLRRVASLLPDGEEVIRSIENKAFRQIQSIISKANKQIKSTIEHLDMDSGTYGTLIIINEVASFFEPDVLVGYINKMLTMTLNGRLRFSSIHQIILLQDTHKIKNKTSQNVVIPIYGIVNDKLEVTETTLRADKVLDKMIESYSHFNGFRHIEIDDSESSIDIEKLASEPIKDLNGQEKIEEKYRLNRYMKDYTEKRLIDHGSLVVSLTIAMFLKENPLVLEKNQKMYVIKAFIELLEESRLRPFDLRELNIDAKKFTVTKSKYNTF